MGLGKEYPATWSDLETVGRLTGAVHELKLLRNERTKDEWREAKAAHLSSIDYDACIASAPELTPEQAIQRRTILDIAVRIVESRRDALLSKFTNAYQKGQVV